MLHWMRGRRVSLCQKCFIGRRSAVRHLDKRWYIVLHLWRFSGEVLDGWNILPMYISIIFIFFPGYVMNITYYKYRHVYVCVRPNGYQSPSNRGHPSSWYTRYQSTAGPTKGLNTRPSMRSKTIWCAVIGSSTNIPAYSNRR